MKSCRSKALDYCKSENIKKDNNSKFKAYIVSVMSIIFLVLVYFIAAL